jgi:hypothetical protein
LSPPRSRAGRPTSLQVLLSDRLVDVEFAGSEAIDLAVMHEIVAAVNRDFDSAAAGDMDDVVVRISFDEHCVVYSKAILMA